MKVRHTSEISLGFQNLTLYHTLIVKEISQDQCAIYIKYVHLLLFLGTRPEITSDIVQQCFKDQ